MVKSNNSNGEIKNIKKMSLSETIAKLKVRIQGADEKINSNSTTNQEKQNAMNDEKLEKLENPGNGTNSGGAGNSGAGNSGAGNNGAGNNAANNNGNENNENNAANNNGVNNNKNAVPEGFTNFHVFGLHINRTCLILILIYVLVFMYKEDIMKMKFVNNLVK